MAPGLVADAFTLRVMQRIRGTRFDTLRSLSAHFRQADFFIFFNSFLHQQREKKAVVFVLFNQS